MYMVTDILLSMETRKQYLTIVFPSLLKLFKMLNTKLKGYTQVLFMDQKKNIE